MKNSLCQLENGQPIALAEIPYSCADDFTAQINTLCQKGWRICSYFGLPDHVDQTALYCLLASPSESILGVLRSSCIGKEFPSIAKETVQAQLFEREIAEQCGIRFAGHPWFKPVRFTPALSGDAWGRQPDQPVATGVMDFYQVDGNEVHEVAVGPVHAGVIEPGHFRFQCHGEQVFHLEISLGYQHRGVENLLSGGPYSSSLRQIETVAGDTSIAHGTAYCMVLEGLSGVQPPYSAQLVRALALELERLANHTGDLGAIAADVGYLPTASYNGRIRGDFLNMSAALCGSRFGRGLLLPGGVGFGMDKKRCELLLKQLATARNELVSSVKLLWGTPSVMGRLEGTGAVTRDMAIELGLVGVAARASGLRRDLRTDLPFGIYRQLPITMVTSDHGDVCSRTKVRWQETLKSIDYCEMLLHQPFDEPYRQKPDQLLPEHLIASLIEGWRGEVCHLAITGADGCFRKYKITDPSFHNWQGLAMALRNEQISDFPLCNKSFNLSYCGFDL